MTDVIFQIIATIVSIAAIVISLKSFHKSKEAIELTKQNITFTETSRANDIRPFFEISGWDGITPKLKNIGGGPANVQHIDNIDPRNWCPHNVKPSIVRPDEQIEITGRINGRDDVPIQEPECKFDIIFKDQDGRKYAQNIVMINGGYSAPKDPVLINA